MIKQFLTTLCNLIPFINTKKVWGNLEFISKYYYIIYCISIQDLSFSLKWMDFKRPNIFQKISYFSYFILILSLRITKKYVLNIIYWHAIEISTGIQKRNKIGRLHSKRRIFLNWFLGLRHHLQNNAVGMSLHPRIYPRIKSRF